jgi:organic anion transporter 5A
VLVKDWARQRHWARRVIVGGGGILKVCLVNWFGWMVGWLDGWMVGWLDGWMVGWLDGWMVFEFAELVVCYG